MCRGLDRVNHTSNNPNAPLPHDASDADLMAHLAAGNPAAMDLLYDRYNRPVYSFAYRMLGDQEHAEDLLQEVFLRAWRRGSRFTETRGSLISWLLSITHNMAIDELRKQQRRPRKADSPEPDMLLASIQDSAEPVESQAILADRQRIIRNALVDLPGPQRQVLELAYFNGLTQREIAEQLDTPLGTIKTRMRLGLRKLQESIDIQALDRS
jgi:RNA polymerase sigma-70 factor (ECF subfamily)